MYMKMPKALTSMFLPYMTWPMAVTQMAEMSTNRVMKAKDKNTSTWLALRIRQES
jgi:hypothetical protein